MSSQAVASPLRLHYLCLDGQVRCIEAIKVCFDLVGSPYVQESASTEWTQLIEAQLFAGLGAGLPSPYLEAIWPGQRLEAYIGGELAGDAEIFNIRRYESHRVALVRSEDREIIAHCGELGWQSVAATNSNVVIEFAVSVVPSWLASCEPRSRLSALAGV